MMLVTRGLGGKTPGIASAGFGAFSSAPPSPPTEWGFIGPNRETIKKHARLWRETIEKKKKRNDTLRWLLLLEM